MHIHIVILMTFSRGMLYDADKSKGINRQSCTEDTQDSSIPLYGDTRR